MRNLEGSAWMGNPDLRIVEAKGPDKRSRYQFTLTVNLKKPKVEGEEGAEGAVEADAAAQGAAS